MYKVRLKKQVYRRRYERRHSSHDLFRHAILLPCAKFHWNRTIGCWRMAKKRFLKQRPSAILNF